MSIFWRSVSFIKNKWWLILIFLVVVGFVVFKIFGPKDESKKPSTYVVKRQDLKETISFAGEIDAKEKALLRFQTSGYLNWVGVKVGDQVKPFQVIASLDQQELQKNLQKYLNTYLSERWDFEENRDDNQGQIMHHELKRTAEKYQFDLNNAVLDVELRNLALKYANLWTPIEGIVTQIDTPNAGVNITPTAAEFEVINPKSLYFLATVDQTEVTKISSSMAGQLVLDAFDDKKFVGTVSRIGFVPKTGESGTVYELEIVLSAEMMNLPIRMGMTGDVEFVLKEYKNVLSVPRNYVKTENKKKYVQLQKGTGIEKTFVTLGQELDDNVEIKEGLKEGDTVVQ